MQSTEKDQLFMGLAIELAHTAYENDEVPVGAVIVQRRNSEVLSAFSNQMRATKSSINHAEMLAIQKAMDLIKNERLIDCDMYVSLEPCPMCAYAISKCNIDTLYFGAEDVKGGGVINGPRISFSENMFKPDIISGIFEDESTKLLKSFFKAKR